jgi:hypothetical protein
VEEDKGGEMYVMGGQLQSKYHWLPSAIALGEQLGAKGMVCVGLEVVYLKGYELGGGVENVGVRRE